MGGCGGGGRSALVTRDLPRHDFVPTFLPRRIRRKPRTSDNLLGRGSRRRLGPTLPIPQIETFVFVTCPIVVMPSLLRFVEIWFTSNFINLFPVMSLDRPTADVRLSSLSSFFRRRPTDSSPDQLLDKYSCILIFLRWLQQWESIWNSCCFDVSTVLDRFFANVHPTTVLQPVSCLSQQIFFRLTNPITYCHKPATEMRKLMIPFNLLGERLRFYLPFETN